MFVLVLMLSACALAGPRPVVLLPDFGPATPLQSLRLVNEQMAADSLQDAVELAAVEDALVEGGAPADARVVRWGVQFLGYGGPSVYHLVVRASPDQKVRCTSFIEHDAWDAWVRPESVPVDAQVIYESMAPSCVARIRERL